MISTSTANRGTEGGDYHEANFTFRTLRLSTIQTKPPSVAGTCESEWFSLTDISRFILTLAIISRHGRPPRKWRHRGAYTTGTSMRFNLRRRRSRLPRTVTCRTSRHARWKGVCVIYAPKNCTTAHLAAPRSINSNGHGGWSMARSTYLRHVILKLVRSMSLQLCIWT